MTDTDTDTESSTAPASPAAAATRREPDGDSTYAIIETGGKQYRVGVGDRLAIEKLPAETGADVVFDRVLMVGGAGAPRVGAPLLAGASVSATVEDQFRGPKIVVFKFKPKKRYRRRTGHRQALTRVAITAINA
jgi:large subunit ribosomal protein L21